MTFIFNDLEVHVTEIVSLHEDTLRPSPEILEDLTRAVKKAKYKLRKIFFRNFSDREFQVFTKLHHEALIGLLDQLLTRIDLENTKRTFSRESAECDSPLEYMQTAYQILYELLEFFQYYYDKHIPRQQVIPHLLMQPLLLEIKGYKKYVLKNFDKGTDPELGSIMIKPFTDFIVRPHKATWHNLFYCRLLHKEFQKLVQSKTRKGTLSLVFLLYNLNFNSNVFYRHLTNFIMQTGKENYLGHLYYCQKVMRQSNIKPNISYKNDNISLQTIMEKWFDEEIRYLERTHQLKLNLASPSKETEPQVSSKIFANLSVSELAYGFKVLVETKMLKVENYKEFFRTVSSMYRTPGSENISSESLRSKYYKPEPGARAAIKDRIIRMINYINTNANILIFIGVLGGTWYLQDWTMLF